MNPNNNSKEPIRVYTQREIAGALGLCPETISRWTTAGIIPCHRVGRVIRYDLTAVLAAIEKAASKKKEDVR